MKKLTVMAACAALLLGGGCFLKANQMNLSLLENIEVFTQIENYRYPNEGAPSGTCGAYGNAGYCTETYCHVCKSEALAVYNLYKAMNCTAYWCCDSCGSTFYCG